MIDLQIREWRPGVIAGAATYLYVWLSPRTTNVVLWAALCLFGGLLASLLTPAKIRIVLASVVMGAAGLNLLHIGVDLAADPTSHNLFPIELAFTLLITAVCSVLGIGLARTARRLIL